MLLVFGTSRGEDIGGAGTNAVDFPRDVAPIFRQHCLRCHRPGNPEGDMQLATFVQLRENDFVVPGDPDGSYLVDLIASVDGQPPAMPKEGKPLAERQVDLIRRWILEGAAWPEDFEIKQEPKSGPDWWAFQPLNPPNRRFPSGTEMIDGLVADKLHKLGLKRNPPADRSTLIRRATYDLIGLPPTPEEVDAFVKDPSPDAYEKLVDRLLASPHYGEQWGRHWLDVVRFGESVGFERNEIIDDLWPFRDYVIGCLNQDQGFDQVIRQHVAGDVLDPNDPRSMIGSAFLVAGPYDNVNNQDEIQKAQIRANTIDEIIRASSEAFLGLTVGCARCHDHKFDPITQQDYYSLYATFSGIRHGSAPWVGRQARLNREKETKPLNGRIRSLQEKLEQIREDVVARAEKQIRRYEKRWKRSAVDRSGTVEHFPTVEAKFVRLVCEAQDITLTSDTGWRIDEMEIWSDQETPVNVALASRGSVARGKSRKIEDFPGAYGPQIAIDGKTGARFIAAGNDLTIELARPTPINRIVFSSAKGEPHPEHRKFVFVAEYRVEVSRDGEVWTEVASGRDREPVNVVDQSRPVSHRAHRLFKMAVTDDEKERQQSIRVRIAQARRRLASLEPFPKAWIGTRDSKDSAGPFHVFLGGNPQTHGDQVDAGSLSVFDQSFGGDSDSFSYRLDDTAGEAERRLAFANWLTDPANPLTPRVLVNRLWQYHFGTGLVATPSDFGFMGGPPSHPELLDFLADELISQRWRIKPMHRMIMLSDTYRQSSLHRPRAASLDAQARTLWRFPPRRLSAEEIRDTILQVSGSWWRRSIDRVDKSPASVSDGGPGFRLYQFMRDNVSTYKPLPVHGPETFRRAVYHQNARASVVDLLTDFDQPDCAFSTPRRSKTTTPLQALTMLNHDFTLEMADALADRLRSGASDVDAQVRLAYRLGYTRQPNAQEVELCREFIRSHDLSSFCRAFLNTSELIYIR